MAGTNGQLAFKGSGIASGKGLANGLGVRNIETISGKVLKESGSFVLAEGLSIITGLGVVAVADKIIPKAMMDSASSAIAKVAIEPFLDNIEHVRDKLCKLKECQTDHDVPREQRAQQIAKTVMIFGAAYATSMAVKLMARRWLVKKAGLLEDTPGKLAAGAGLWEKIKYYGTFQNVTPQEKLIFAADESVHYGSLWLMNSPLAPVTDDLIQNSTDMLQKVTGCDEKKARQLSDMFWIWDAPNILGGLAGIGVIAANHGMGLSTTGWLGKFLANKLPAETSHVEKLALQGAKNPHLSITT